MFIEGIERSIVLNSILGHNQVGYPNSAKPFLEAAGLETADLIPIYGKRLERKKP